MRDVIDEGIVDGGVDAVEMGQVVPPLQEAVQAVRALQHGLTVGRQLVVVASFKGLQAAIQRVVQADEQMQVAAREGCMDECVGLISTVIMSVGDMQKLQLVEIATHTAPTS